MTKLSGFLKHNLSYALLLASLIALALGIARQTQVFASPPFQAPGGKPGSRPSNSSAPAFTIHLYEHVGNSPNGAPSDNVLVTLPQNVICGDVVVLEHANGSLTDESTWSDLLRFCDGVNIGTGNTVRFISDSSTPFPPHGTLINPSTIVETQTGSGNDDADVTDYSPTPNIYHIHGDAPVNEPASDPSDLGPAPSEVPEADTLLLMGGGLSGIATWVGWQWRKRRNQK